MKRSPRIRSIGLPLAAAISLALAFVAGRHAPRPVRQDSAENPDSVSKNATRILTRE